MLKAILRHGVRRFEERYNYNSDYIRQIIEHSSSAGLRLGILPLVSQYRGPDKAVGIWAGAALASTLDGDCGSCAQLIVDQAREAGVPSNELAACAVGEPDISTDCGLGFLFAQAAIESDLQTDDLRAMIVDRHGEKAAIAAGFAAATGRVYPVVKRSMGQPLECQPLRF